MSETCQKELTPEDYKIDSKQANSSKKTAFFLISVICRNYNLPNIAVERQQGQVVASSSTYYTSQDLREKINNLHYKYLLNHLADMKRRIYLFLTLFLLTAICASAQTTTASGVVMDEASQPIIGATIREKGVPTNGTTTNTDGRFTIKVKSGATLINSYIGYHPIEIAATTKMTIKMTPDSEMLDEVVVTAMGISRTKKSIGYAAQEVKAEDLQKARVTDVNNALVGKVSGLRFLGGSGSNFDAGTIVLRGTNSLYDPAGAEPIYVIDGVITNKNALNMDDVESINVLKGPAATSLYGS